MENQGICCNALIQKPEGEILLVRRAEDDEAFPGNWELPGGGIDYGETVQASLTREVKEECGLSIVVTRPLTVNNFYIENIQYFEITYLCKVQDNSWDITLSKEHSEYKWVTFKELGGLNISDYMMETLRTSEKNL